MEAVLCILKASAIPVCTKIFPRANQGRDQLQSTKDRDYYSKLAAFIYALYCSSAASDLAPPGTQPLQSISTTEFCVHVGEAVERGMLVMLVCAPTFSFEYGQDLLRRLCVTLDEGRVDGIFTLNSSRAYIVAIERFFEHELQSLTEQLVSQLFHGANLVRTAPASAVSGLVSTSDDARTSITGGEKADATLVATHPASDLRSRGSIESLERDQSLRTSGSGGCGFFWWLCGSGTQLSSSLVVPIDEYGKPQPQIWEILVGEALPNFGHTLVGQLIPVLLNISDPMASATSLERCRLDGQDLPRPFQTALLHHAGDHAPQNAAMCPTLHGLSVESQVFVWSGLEPNTIRTRLAEAGPARTCIHYCQLKSCRE